jgi:hypothetical protein
MVPGQFCMLFDKKEQIIAVNDNQKLSNPSIVFAF